MSAILLIYFDPIRSILPFSHNPFFWSCGVVIHINSFPERRGQPLTTRSWVVRDINQMGSKKQRLAAAAAAAGPRDYPNGSPGFWMFWIGVVIGLYVLYHWIDHESHKHVDIGWYALWSIRFPSLLRLLVLAAGFGISVFATGVYYDRHRKGPDYGGAGMIIVVGIIIGAIGLIGSILYCVVAYRWDGFVINPPHSAGDGSGPGVMALLIPHTPVMYVVFFAAMAVSSLLVPILRYCLCGRCSW